MTPRICNFFRKKSFILHPAGAISLSFFFACTTSPVKPESSIENAETPQGLSLRQEFHVGDPSQVDPHWKALPSSLNGNRSYQSQKTGSTLSLSTACESPTRVNPSVAPLALSEKARVLLRSIPFDRPLFEGAVPFHNGVAWNTKGPIQVPGRTGTHHLESLVFETQGCVLHFQAISLPPCSQETSEVLKKWAQSLRITSQNQ